MVGQSSWGSPPFFSGCKMDQWVAGVSTVPAIILLIVFGLILFQEAVNGFHDVANAIATVIYSNALTPTQSVVLAATFNFLGVLLGGTAVAFGLVYLLPESMVAGINTRGEAALFFAMIVAAVVWNFGTWWLGIPSSTTHAYIGAILGIAMADAFLAGRPVADQINWLQGERVMLALMLSPLVGFVLGFVLLALIRWRVRDPAMYQPVEGSTPPSPGIRRVLIAGAAGVSLMHGSNDGQKSIGLMMIVLFGLLPALYGLDPQRLDKDDYARLSQHLVAVSAIASDGRAPEVAVLAEDLLKRLETEPQVVGGTAIGAQQLRTQILRMNTELTRLRKDHAVMNGLQPDQQRQVIQTQALLRDFVEHVPFWVVLLSALALGGGTALGYRRIVTTLGEKMGSHRMTPAQGIAAQTSAVISIAMADGGGLPVSTTHVLSSAVVGSVAATPGHSVNRETLARIAITWVTTLPATILLSFALGVAFYAAFA
jgi:phosphate/sulfate permease